jgi:hypothetical protein
MLGLGSFIVQAKVSRDASATEREVDRSHAKRGEDYTRVQFELTRCREQTAFHSAVNKNMYLVKTACWQTSDEIQLDLLGFGYQVRTWHAMVGNPAVTIPSGMGGPLGGAMMYSFTNPYSQSSPETLQVRASTCATVQHHRASHHCALGRCRRFGMTRKRCRGSK